MPFPVELLWIAAIAGAAGARFYIDARARRVERLALAERNPAFTFALSLREILDDPERWSERLDGLVATIVVAEEAVQVEGSIEVGGGVGTAGAIWNYRAGGKLDSPSEQSELRRRLVVYLIDRNSEIHTIAAAPLGGDTGAVEALAREAAKILSVPFRGLGD